VQSGSRKSAVARLPGYGDGTPEAARKSGTYDAPIHCTENCTSQAAKQGTSVRGGALQAARGACDASSENTRENARFNDENRGIRTGVKERPQGDSNPCSRLEKPVS
jgi:hypothetical protein